MNEDIHTIGLIAGSGKFPILFSRAARDQKIKVVAAGVKGDTSFFLRVLVDQFRLFGAGELRKVFEYFQAHNIRHVIMAGQVNPGHLFDPRVRMDAEFESLFKAIRDRKADTIFSAVADKLQEHGMKLMDSTFLIEPYLAPGGILTKRGPTAAEREDVDFGRHIAKSMGGLDIGQTVVVKEKAIVAIEAMEGTDRCILRGGRIARKGGVVVKMSKPQQDQRFDVPVIGPRTLQNMARVKAGCLAIEEKKTIMIDRDVCVKLADKAGICILAA